MLWFKPKSCLGIDIGAGGIKLVELREEKKRPVLFTYGLTSDEQNVHKIVSTKEVSPQTTIADKENLSGQKPLTIQQMDEIQVDKYADIIRAVCKSAKTTTKQAIVSLPVSSVFHALVTLPLVKKEELDHIIRAEVKKLLPMPLEDMALDYQVLKSEPDARSQRILVNAVPHALIAFYSKIFQKAGLVLEALEPESTALTRCLVGKDQSVNMLIDIGAERTNFFIVEQSVPITHQIIESGGVKADRILRGILGVGQEEVGQVKHDLFNYLSSTRDTSLLSEQKFIDIMMPVIDPITKEIGLSFELFLRQSGNENKKPEKIILTGGMGFMPYLANYISDKFKVKCFLGDPWARVVYQEGLKPMLHQVGPRMSVAIGLALRNMVL
jgi:type IV pilus assembly protein PilM